MIEQNRWDRIEELFHLASQLSGDGQVEFLDRECREDTALRHEVESLLKAAAPSGSELDAVVIDAVSSSTDALIGTNIGPYRILRILGRGGMGTVYLAERADGEYAGQVAIKVSREGPGGDELLRRFRIERQILANLQHPNIARLLDGGTTSSGAPYVVMEYVEGIRIDRYCDDHQLDVRARFALMRLVAGAVDHANRNLIVHRDLKPGNILVTGDGTPKLLDFGIAKLLDAEPGQDVTRTAMRLLTPAYASPEQIAGETITTASDVYSLGVVCYEILTGRLPNQIEHARSPAEIVRIISQSTATRPSETVTTGKAEELAARRGASADQLRRYFSGDLDAILLTALRKEPERRYRTAGDFDADLGRFLDGRPVAARPDTLGYRVSRFTRRHRIGVTAATTAVLVLILAIGFYTARLASERDRARVEAAKAGQVAAFLQELFEVSDPAQSRTTTITARELLDRGAARVATQLDGQPEVQATLMQVIGRVYGSLGMYQSARDQSMAALERRRRIHGAPHHDVAESERELANALGGLGEFPAAEQHFREALAIERELHDGDDGHVVTALASVGSLLKAEAGRLGEAESLFREALAMRERLGPDAASLAMVLDGLAGTLHGKGDYAGAEPLYRQSVELVRSQVPVDSAILAIALHNLSLTLVQVGKLDEAIESERHALSIAVAFLGPNHPHVSSYRNGLGMALRNRGDFAGAVEQFRASIASDSVRLGPDHENIGSHFGLLGTTLLSMSLLNEAEVALRRALEIRRKAYGTAHPYFAISVNELSGLHLARGDIAEAEAGYRQALALRRAHQPPHYPYIAYSLVGLARTLMTAKRSVEAIPLLIEADSIRRGSLPEGHRLRLEVDSLLRSARTGAS